MSWIVCSSITKLVGIFRIRGGGGWSRGGGEGGEGLSWIVSSSISKLVGIIRIRGGGGWAGGRGGGRGGGGGGLSSISKLYVTIRIRVF